MLRAVLAKGGLSSGATSTVNPPRLSATAHSHNPSSYRTSTHHSWKPVSLIGRKLDEIDDVPAVDLISSGDRHPLLVRHPVSPLLDSLKRTSLGSPQRYWGPKWTKTEWNPVRSSPLLFVAYRFKPALLQGNDLIAPAYELRDPGLITRRA
jgi:hypothetical protein